ncbi:MAG: N-acetylmuramoyl-L-alanine amidase [Defluviitaleaceae bacterium]|nr:N-acetylmuramoyl-L-alanine amidase [Defluviitaleaceae bacterium]
MRRIISVLLLALIVAAIFAPQAAFATSVNKKIIVIDAGHGGWDPGKVGKNNEEEKTINLAIAEDLQMLLELGGAMVFMTRGDDMALADRKNADLLARSAMPSDMQAHIFISIHQNAFPQESVKGAQVFYYTGSEASEKLADAIQGRIRSYLDENNRKETKADKNYLLLRETKTPAVIVECGFLTNNEDLRRLMQQDYQEKVAWAIYLGVLDYFANAQ